MTTALQSAQDKIVYAGNGSLSDNDRSSIATDLQGIRDQLLNLANSTDGNGRYIFAGYKTDAPAFDQATGKYDGGDTPIRQQVDSARNMQISHTGLEVFESFTSNAAPEPDGSAPEKNLFKILDNVIAALKTPVSGDQGKSDQLTLDIDKANRGLRNSLDNVLTVRADLGTKLTELDALDTLGSDRALGQTQQMSDLVDVDWNSAISSYVMQQAALQASYKAFSDMQGMSLFQLNK